MGTTTALPWQTWASEMVRDQPQSGNPTAGSEDRVDVLLSLDAVFETIGGDEASDGTTPTPEQRRIAAERVAAAADADPTAVAHRAGDVVATLATFPPWSTADDAGSAGTAVPLGPRNRIVRQLCAAIESIATAVPWALVDDVGTIRTGLTAGPVPQRLRLGRALVAVAEEHPDAIDGGALPFESLLDGADHRLRQVGAELVAAIAQDQPTVVATTLPALLDCLDAPDSTLREVAADAIHEISVVRPSAVVDETAVVGRLATDPNQTVRDNAVRTLIELCGTDDEAVWEQEHRIREALDSETTRTREIVALLLFRMASEAPGAVARRHSLVTAVLGDDTADVRETGPWILQELAASVPAEAAPGLPAMVDTALQTVTDPEHCAKVLLAGSVIVEAADESLPSLDLAEIYPLLGADDPGVRAAAAAFLQAVNSRPEFDVRQDRLADVDGVELPDEPTDDVVEETLDRVKTRAAEAGEHVQTEFDPSVSGFRPGYRLVAQEDFTTVIERVHRRIRADSPDVMSDLGALVGFLDTETDLVLEHTLGVIFVLANRNPAAVARHLEEVIPLVTHSERAVRNRALMITNVCFQYRPHRVLADIEYFVDALDYETHTTSQLLSRVFLLVRNEQVSALVPHIETLLDAWSDSHPVRTYVIEAVLRSVVSSRPDALSEHYETLLSYSGRELEIDPDNLEEVDAVEDVERAPDDDTIQTLIPLDFLLDEDSQVSSRPGRSALRSLVLTYPDIVVQNQAAIRDLLAAESAATRKYALRLIELSAVGEDERVATFSEELVDRINREDDPGVREQAVSTFHEVAEAAPAAVAPFVEVVYPIIADGHPERPDDDVDDETGWALKAVAECVDELPAESYPTVEQILPYLEHSSDGSAAVVEIFAALVDVEAEALRAQRSTVVEWCSEDRHSTAQVDAIEVLHRLGTRSTIGSLVACDD